MLNNNIINMKTAIITTTLTFSLLIGCINCTPKTEEEPIETKVITYAPDNSKFPNPERGFYKYSSCNLGTGTGFLSESTLRAYRNNNISLIFRYFYLKNFRNFDDSVRHYA